MNRQEVFNRVRKHLLEQKQAAIENGSCKYRTSGGMKCAVGCLLKDEHYSPSLEGVTIIEAMGNSENVRFRTKQLQAAVAASLGLDTLESDDISFLRELQCVHDSECEQVWEACLSDIADTHGLTIE